MAADQRFRLALRDVAEALNEIDAPSMIIGGIAVIAAGVPRETIDIDATISGRSTDIETVLAVFKRHGIIPRIVDAVAFARDRQVLLLKHESSGVTIEVTFAWLPFEEEALRHSRDAHRSSSRSDRADWARSRRSKPPHCFRQNGRARARVSTAQRLAPRN